MKNTILKKTSMVIAMAGALAMSAPLMALADNPVPAITSVSPGSAAQGSSNITLTVNGNNFVNTSVVYFNGFPRPTFFNSQGQLTATIFASDLTASGNYNVSVMNPSPGGGFSNNAVFGVTLSTNPVPSISSISPAVKTAGDAAFTITVNGSNFVAGSAVRLDGSARPTTFVSSTQLTATIPAADVASTGNRSITVANPTPGGGVSNALTLSVNLANQTGAPVVTSTSPAGTVMGSGAFTLSVNGSGFDTNSFIRFNGIAKATTYVSPSLLTTTINPAEVAVQGNQAVSVSDPERGNSNNVLFAVNLVPGLPNTGYGPTVDTLYGLFALATVGAVAAVALWRIKKAS